MVRLLPSCRPSIQPQRWTGSPAMRAAWLAPLPILPRPSTAAPHAQQDPLPIPPFDQIVVPAPRIPDGDEPATAPDLQPFGGDTRPVAPLLRESGQPTLDSLLPDA